MTSLADETETIVDQAIDQPRGRAGRFRKSIHLIRFGDASAGGLVHVRKRAVAPAPAAAAPPASRGAVLLLHGYAQNRYAWHTSLRSFASFLAAEGFDVWNLDFRGAGRSREMGTPAAASFADYVEGDLPRAVSRILAATGERRLFLVGHSLGGAVACAFAGRAPELVRGIVTLCGLYDFGRRNRFVRLLGLAARALEGFGVAPYVLPDPLPTDVVGRALAFSRAAWDTRLASLLPLQAWAPGSIEDEVILESIRRSFEPASLGLTLGLARMARGGTFCDARGRSYLGDFEARAEVPILVATGCADPLITCDDSRGAVDRSRARDKTLRRFETTDGGVGWGHIDLIMGRNAPEHVWPEVAGWLAAR